VLLRGFPRTSPTSTPIPSLSPDSPQLYQKGNTTLTPVPPLSLDPPDLPVPSSMNFLVFRSSPFLFPSPRLPLYCQVIVYLDDELDVLFLL